MLDMITNLNRAILIPTYNEADNVGKLYEQIKSLSLNARLLFVDDNSPDGTGKILDEIASRDPNVEVIHRPGKQGIGSAHATGIRAAYERGIGILITMDCDFTHSPDHIGQFLAYADDFDVVVGSRFIQKDSLKSWNLYRKFLTHLGHFLTVSVLNVPFDATGAFRLYRIDRIPRDVFNLVTSTGYSYFFESILILHLNGCTIKEVPIELPFRIYGKSKMQVSDIITSLRYLFRMWRTKAFHRHKLLCRTGKEGQSST